MTASPQTTGLGQIKETIAKLKALKNPEAAMQMLMQQKNPNMAKAMDYVKQHGGDPKAAFEALAKESGIDPSEIMSMLK